MRRVPLLWQLLAINAVLIGGTVMTAVLTIRPDLGTASGRQPIVVLGGGVLAVLLGNLLLLRRRLQPLARLIDTMERVDLSAHGRRADPDAGESVEVARLHAKINPHAPGRYRTNGAVSNMPEFAAAFSCKADAPMVNRPVCRVW